MKAILSDKVITPYGGAVPFFKKIKEFGIPKVIRESLPSRKKNVTYTNDQVILGWVFTAITGGFRLEHISKLHRDFTIIPGLKIPSHDTVGRGLKQLATPTEIDEHFNNHGDTKIIKTYYNDNIPMNRMLIRATKRMGGLVEGKKYILDIDATFLASERRGAVRNTDKNGKIDYTRIGFSPMVAMIDYMPVNISLRNGNAGSSFRICEFLKTTLDLLEESKIQIGCVVSDASGYNKKAMDMLDDRGIKFNIRWKFNTRMYFKTEIINWEDWKPTEIKTANHIWKCEIADIPYSMFKRYDDTSEDKTYRIVAIRIPNDETRKDLETAEEQFRREQVKELLKGLAKKKILKELQKPYEDTNWKQIDGFAYKFFITNDYKKTGEEIVYEYNKRGKSERNFSFMKRDFGWSLPPFMDLNENTVFLITAALANNLFRSIVRLCNKSLPKLKLSNRLREFIYLFINVSCEYLGDGIYQFYSKEILYVKLME